MRMVMVRLNARARPGNLSGRVGMFEPRDARFQS